MGISSRTASILAAAVVSVAPALAAAQEVDVAEAYDRLYRTDYTARGGLAEMRASIAAPTRATYSLRDMRFVEVLAFDTAGTPTLYLLAQGQQIPLFASEPSEDGSRGWRPDNGRRIDLARALAEHGIDPTRARFQLAVDDAVMDAENTHTFFAPRRREFLLAHNGGGIDNADADANEPLLRCFGGTRMRARALAFKR